MAWFYQEDTSLYTIMFLVLQMWASEAIPEWLWMWGATRLNNALRRQAKDRLGKKTMKSSDSLNTLAEGQQS